MHTGERSCNSPNGLRLPPRHHSLRGCCGLLFGANTKHGTQRTTQSRLSVAHLPHEVFLSTEPLLPLDTSKKGCPKFKRGQMKKAGLANWRTPEGLPSVSDPETEADRTLRGSLLACMTANREPSNQSFETDREATVCAASRRFLPLCGQEAARTRGTSLAADVRSGPCPTLVLPVL
jgi:hypothetical protein